MGNYFGTDGIRGRANVELDASLAYRTGLALGTVLREELGESPWSSSGGTPASPAGCWRRR